MTEKLEPIEGEAQDLFKKMTDEYTAKLLHHADLLARARPGTRIDVGDLLNARKEIERPQRERQETIMLFASALVGGGLAGVTQNYFDQKPIVYLVAFAGMFLLGVLLIWYAKAPKKE